MGIYFWVFVAFSVVLLLAPLLPSYRSKPVSELALAAFGLGQFIMGGVIAYALQNPAHADMVLFCALPVVLALTSPALSSLNPRAKAKRRRPESAPMDSDPDPHLVT